MEGASNHLLGDLAVRKGRHCGEGVPVIGIAQAELPQKTPSTGEHRAVLCQDHRVLAARNHLLGDLAIWEGRHRGEGVPVIVIAQAELPINMIAPAGEHGCGSVGEEQGSLAGNIDALRLDALSLSLLS